MRQLLLVVFLFATFSLFAQITISGGSNVNGNYSTLAAAITALNGATISGPVTVDVVAGHTETLSSRINMTATGTAANPITIQKSGMGANPVLTAYTGLNTPSSQERDGLFSLSGCDWVTIDGINLQENPANSNATEWMEYGYGLFKNSDTDGCQNNTIRNCTITLNRDNVAAGAGVWHPGSNGIVVLWCSATSNTGITPTAASGTNSFNKFYSNTIQNVQHGITFISFSAPSPFTLADTGNDVGGTSPATGNTFLNFGGGVGTTATAEAGFVNNQWDFNFSYNTVNNNNGGGVNHPNTLYGIWLNSSGTSANVTVNNNNFNIKGGGTTQVVAVIRNEMGSTPAGNTININNNTLIGEYLTATTGGFYGIWNSASPANLNMNNNTISGMSYSNAAATGTGVLYGIHHSVSNALTVSNCNNNSVSNLTRTGTTGGTTIGIAFTVGTTGMIANINGNTINNLSIDGTGTTSTMYGIQSSTGTISVNNNVISNLTCIKTSGTGVLYGIYNISSPVNENYNGNTIFNLTHNGTGTLYGLYAFTTTGVRTVSDNTIYNLVTGGTTISGIQMSSSSPSIFRNKVYNVRSNSAGAPTVSGIMLTSMGTSGVANIYNNLIGDLTAPNASSSTATAPTLRGINLTTTSTGSVNVSFNTIYLSGSTSGANFATAGLFATTSTTATASELFLRNNIIVNLSQPKGTGNAVAYQRSSTALNNYNNASNNNLFYAGTPGATNLIFFDGTNASQTIDAFKTLVSPRESNSITENPSFLSVVGASSDFLHINPAIPTQIESGGINIAGITTDYDNDIRAGNPGYAGAGVAPDLGADEGDFAVLDLSGPIITYTQLPNACTTGDRTLSGVSIADATGIPTSGSLVPRIYYRKPAGSWFSRPGTFVSGNTNNSIWNFTIVVADIGGLMVGDVVEYYVIAQDVVVPVNISSNPSGAVATDVNTVITHPASPNTFNVVNSLSGTYTVGSGGDFPTLTAALAAYNANCIVGAVTFNLTDATYPSETFPLTIGANSFASEINTLTIKPNSSATIEGTHAGCILALSGADFVTIDGSNSGGTDRSLSIINNSIVTNTAAICVLSLGSNQGATNNTIKNVNILAGEIGSTTTLNTFSVFVASLPISNTATGADNDNLIIENNSIRKARYGIYARGTSVANANDGLMISGNDIGSANQSEYVTFRGIDITNAEAPEIDGNFIFNLKQTLSTSNAAIDFGSGVNNGVISRNVISGIYSESTGGWGAYGINFSSTTSVNNNVISNNFITDIRTVNYSTGSTTFNAFGIRLAGGTNTKVFFNSINLFGDIIIVSGTPTQPNSAPLVVTTTSVTGLQVKNNIFRNVQTFISGSPKTYSIWFPTSYTGYTLMDNNAYYGTNGPSGNPTTYHVGRIGAVDYTTLASWQGITNPQEANSVFVDPVFVNDLDLHLVSGSNPLLAGGGMPLADVVDDIDGNLRSNPPTIGGHELNVLICSVEIEDVNSENYCGFSPAGSIQIDASCNGCTLEYSINNGNTWAASPVFNGLAAGTYNVLVRDAVNPVCTETWSGNPITIVSFPEPVVTINSSNMAMCVGDTRQLTGTPVGGVFEVASGPGTIGAGDVLTATGEGVIQLFYTVTDNNGCTGLASQTITVNALPAASIAITETSGIENNDGNICLGASVTLTASGGTSYLWNDGSTTSSITIQPADDTTYSVTVTSSAGCTSVASVTIIVNPNPTAEVEPFESQICQGESITLTASGGVSYLWDTGATTESITVSPNMSTQYGVTVTDVNGCSNTAFADVTVSPAPVISNIVLGEPEDCVSEDGSIEYSVTGNSPYTFTWSTPNGAGIVQGEQNQFALTVGTYFLTVTDEEGCTAAASFTLVGPGNCGNCPLMGPLTAAPNPVCAGANTTLQVTGLTEMNPTYGVSFVYFNAPTMNPYSGGTVIATIPNNGLGGGGTTATTTTSFGTAGAYFIYTILSPVPTDPACRPSSAVTLVVNPLPVITIGITENSGNTPNDGIICQGASVTLSASGGTGYVWSTGATTSGITVAPASTTTYTVTVSDANSCTAVSSVTITVNPNPVVSITTTENSGNQPNDGNICRGSSVTLTASGGTSYLWSTGATTQAITVAPTSNTTYSVTVTNSNGCTGVNSVNIIVNIPPTVTISGATTICNGQSTTLTASGGVSYLWSTGATTQAITVAPVANTTYTVTATDANGCTGTSSVLVTVAAVPTVNPVANQTYCNGQTVPAVVFSGTPSGVVFSWTRTPAAIGLAPTAGTGNVPSFTASNTGTTPLSSTFTVTPQITVNGVTCTGNPITFTITVNPTPVVNPVSNISTCAGLTVPAITFSGNVPGAVYNWTRTAEPIGAALSGTNTVPAFVATNPGQTAITSTFTVTPVFTNGGVFCSGQSITFTIRVEPAPTALCRNVTINLDANGNGSISVADVNNGSFGGVITLSRTNFDCSNIGPNTVILTVTSPCNTTSTCSAIVTVRDVTPPAITCPPSINRTLDPGACCEILNWPDAVATDNCPLVSTTGNIFTTTAGNPANFFNSFAGITFDVRNETGGNLNITGFRVPVTGASVPATFNVYVTTTASTNVGNQANPAAWTLVGSFTTPGIPPTATAWNVNTFTQVNISGITLAGGQSRGVYILLANYPTGGSLRYTNGTFTETNGTMTVLSNGYGGTQVPFNNTFFPRAFVGEVQYSSLIGGLTVVKVSGPDSGDEFCKDDSPWTVVYRATDGSGNSSTCSFGITVRDFPNPIQSIACNDLVYVSVDENCQAIVGADMVLEGGPYSCYDDYTVELRLNGVLQNPRNVVDHRHIGRTLEATVIAPNGNRCWGNIIVEDKIAPNLVCEEAYAECGADITPCASTGNVFIPGDTIQFPASFVPHGGGTAFTLQGNNLPGGVYFNLRNNSGSPLTVTGFGVRFGNPSFGQVNAPQTLDIYTAATFVGNETNAAAWTNRGPAIVDAIPPHVNTGTGSLAQARMTAPVIIPAGETRGFHIFGRTACPVFNYFNNTGPFTNGPWTCTGGPVSFGLLSNLFQAGASSMPNIQVNTGIQGPAPCLPNGLRLGVDAFLTGNRTYRVSRNTGDPILETCSDVTLTYEDHVNPSSCQGQFWQTVERTWVTVDGYGNSSTCVQNINIAKTSLADVCEGLNDYDDQDQPAFACDGNWQRDANGNPHPSVTGMPLNQSCNIQCAYTDIDVPLCGSSSRARKILRRWTCVDWCEPVNRVEVCEQIIKVVDKVSPTVQIQPLALNIANLYQCNYDIRFSRPIVSDGCSTNDADPLHNIVRISVSGPGFDGDFFRRVNGVVTVDNQTFPRNVQPGLQAPIRIAPGNYTVIYRVEDACGNVSEIQDPLIIRDLIPPVAICEKIRVVSLGPDCRVRIPATSFDDGTYDNCELVRMEVARMTTSTCYTPASSALVFRDSVDFCCVDLTATEAQRTVMFRAVDAAGNSNTCMVVVEVQDKLLPVVTCPADVTVDCRDHFGLSDADLAARFGTAVATDNCADQAGQSCFVNLTVVNSPDLQCRQGSVTRVFTATDAANNVSRCTQRITVVNNFPFDGSFYRVFAQIRNAQSYAAYPNGPYEDNTPAGQKVYSSQARANLRPINTAFPTRFDLVWPADLEVNFCGQALEPDALAANPRFVVGSKPFVHREDFCAQIGMTYDEWEFDFDAGCKKIVRLWKVVDWCQAQTVLNPWMWEQIIKVIDTEGPQITAGPFNFCIIAENCTESVTLEAFATDNCATGEQLRWDWEVFPFGDRTNPIRNTQSNLRGESLTLTRTFPLTPDGGPAHIIKYVVEDGCSNKTTREVEFRIRDCKKPTPICFNGLAVDLMPTSGMVDVAAVLFNAGSYDNCTAQPDLRYRIERLSEGNGADVPNNTVLTVTCDDLGSLQIRLWVIDQYGNADFCETYLLVQNNMGADCEEDISGDIAGKLFTESNEGIEEAKVEVTSIGLVRKESMTNVAGNFIVKVPMYISYVVEPFRNDNPANGVSTLDILLIQRHILGLQNLNSPYKLIAADANKSGSITAADLVEIRKVILGKTDMFAGNTSWRFVPTDYVFNNPANAQGEEFPESRIINGMLANMMNENFYGIKIGDVNGSAKANSQSVSGSISRSRSLDLNVADMNLVAGNDYEVAFRASDIANVLGYQFTLNFRPEVVDFAGFEAGALNVTEENFGFTMLKDGMITTSWNTTAPVAVTGDEVLFTLTFRAKTNAMLSEVLTANSRFTSAEAISLEGAEIALNLVFNTENGAVAAGTYELYQNVPNPFANETRINFSLPETMDAVLTVFDVSGKAVKVIRGNYAKGMNGINISKADLPAAGVLYYQLEAGTFKATKKMIILE